MKNYFLKTLVVGFFLFAGLNIASAQNYLPEAEAIEILKTEQLSIYNILEEWNGPKTMDYFKIKSKKKLIQRMIVDFKQGATTQEVAESFDHSKKLNKFQRVVPLFADSKGKVGMNWIDEEIITLLVN